MGGLALACSGGERRHLRPSDSTVGRRCCVRAS